jgi:hypothetical protein
MRPRPSDLVPCDQQVVRVGELPDQPATAVSYRLAGAEPAELGQAPPQDVGLADGDLLRAFDPFASEAGFGHGRVIALEPTGRTGVYEHRDGGSWAIDHVRARQRGVDM